MSETGAEFVERMKREWDGDNVPCVEDFDQLIALARRGAAMQWRPIEEAPSTGMGPQMILGHAEKKWIRFGWYYAACRKWYYSGTSERTQYAQVEGDAPTHFMPLPPPPAGEQG